MMGLMLEERLRLDERLRLEEVEIRAGAILGTEAPSARRLKELESILCKVLESWKQNGRW